MKILTLAWDKVVIAYHFCSKYFDNEEEYNKAIVVFAFLIARINFIITTAAAWGFNLAHAGWAMFGQFFLYMLRLKFGKYFGKYLEFDPNEKIGSKVYNFIIDIMASGILGLMTTPFLIPYLFDNVNVNTQSKQVALTAFIIGLFYEIIIKVAFKAIATRIQKIGKNYSGEKQK